MYSEHTINLIRQRISSLFTVLGGQSPIGKSIATMASPMLGKLDDSHIIKIIDFLVDIVGELMEMEEKYGDN